MPDREDMKSILEACRKTGPMDERLVRGTAESSPRNSEEYHADAMRGTNIFSSRMMEMKIKVTITSNLLIF